MIPGQKDQNPNDGRAVGFARSLLAYEVPDGRLKLLDGHLRRELDPDLEVDVEVLDVNGRSGGARGGAGGAVTVFLRAYRRVLCG